MKKNKLIISMGFLGFSLGVLNCFFGILTFVNPFATFAARWVTKLFFQGDIHWLISCILLIMVSTAMFLVLGYFLRLIEVSKNWLAKVGIVIALILSYGLLYSIGIKNVLLMIGV